jgi:hypothetical protein
MLMNTQTNTIKTKIKIQKNDKKEIEKNNQKKSKKVKKQKIIGKETLYTQNGEIKEVVVVEKNIEQDFNFYKVWLLDLLNVLELVGTKKMKVINYILENLDTKNNIFIGTQQEISEKINVSRKVVNQTFKVLIDSNFLVKKQNGVYMINPDLIVKGKTGKRISLLVEYKNLKND